MPGHEELARGVIATGGVRILDEKLIAQLGLSKVALEAVTSEEAGELGRRAMS